MPLSRMSLADGAKALGLTPNGARSRFKVGTLKGDRDNQGRIWIWVDEEAEGLKTPPSKSEPEGPSNYSKSSIEGSPSSSVEGTSKATSVAFEGHIRTLTEQLARAQDELMALRVRASAADRLEGEVAGLKALRDELRTDRDQWRQMAVERQTAPEVATPASPTPRKRGLFGFIGRAA